MSNYTAALAIIQNAQGKYLLQMRDDNTEHAPLTWCLFGGEVDDGEASKNAASREVNEELGLKTTPENFKFVTQVILSEKNVTYDVYHYSTTLEWGSFVVLEGAGAGFFTIDEIKKLDILPSAKQILVGFEGEE